MVMPAEDPAATAAPTLEAPETSGPDLTMSPEEIGRWKDAIQRSIAARATQEPWWEAARKLYWDSQQNPTHYRATINTLRPFGHVERKKADLFYQRPDVTCQPTDGWAGPIRDANGQPVPGPPGPQGQPMPGPTGAQAIQAHQTVINELLGPDDIDAKRLVHDVLFDVLCTAGTGWTEVGYDSVTQTQSVDDPVTGQAREVPVPVQERCYWEYIEPKRTLRPAEFRSTAWDKAPWLGYQFARPLTDAVRAQWGLSADFTGAAGSAQTQHFEDGVGSEAAQAMVTGVKIWAKSAWYRPDRPHPEHYTLIVFVDGVDAPVVYRDSPYQTLDARGQLTPTSLKGNPIHPAQTRSQTDSAYPPSDIMVMTPLARERDRFREQMLEYRDANILRWRYNTDLIPSDAIDKFVRSPIAGMIGMPAEAMSDEVIKEFPQGHIPRENFAMHDYVDGDIDRALGVDANGAGVQSSASQTATETQIVQANANARFDFERGVILDWYLKGVTKFATIVQQYLPVSEAAQIVGPERAQVWDVWRQTANSTTSWTALPDSALRTDQAIDRKQAQDLYSFLANDPFVNRQALLEKLLRKFHLDPTTIVKQPEPPHAPPPKLNLSFTGEDLVGPQGPIVIEILQQQGIQISPASVQLAEARAQQQAELAANAEIAQAAVKGDTRHGGKAVQTESLSKHHADESGGMQGTGQTAPMGPTVNRGVM